MIKKYLGITLISASLAFAGCSSNDDDDGGDIDESGGEMQPGGDPEEGLGAPAPSNGVNVPAEFTPGDDVAESITEALTTAGSFTALLEVVDASGLGAQLADGAIRTIFAPNDEALRPLVDGGQIPSDQEALQAIVLTHTIEGALDGDLIAASIGQTVESVNGTQLSITQDDDGQILIAGVPIVAIDLETRTGIIHTIDGVIGITGANAAPDLMEGENTQEMPATVDGGDGPGIAAISAAGFTDFVEIWGLSDPDLGTSLDTNRWTVFVPDNASIPEAALSASGTQAFVVLNAHILTTDIFSPAQLLALPQPVTMNNNETMVTFGGTADALTVNGFSVTPIETGGTAFVYSINGLLQ